MIPLNITPDLDANPWTDLQSDNPGVGTVTRVGLLRHGTIQGRATVGVVVTMPDGSRVLAQTTWRLWQTATRALAAGPVGSEEIP